MPFALLFETLFPLIPYLVVIACTHSVGRCSASFMHAVGMVGSAWRGIYTVYIQPWFTPLS